MGYSYKGTKFVDDEPEVINGCGTYAGYRAHQRRGEKPCAECRTAANTYGRERYELKKVAQPRSYQFDPSKCGTNAGYARHQFYKLKPCEPCRKAAAQYIADYRAKRRAA